MQCRNKIIVIGAGASGLTTAIACQIAGFSVKILTKQHPLKDKVSSDFSSHYPAASIIPHSVVYPELLSLFESSNSIFQLLFDKKIPGIEKHKHFEFFSKNIEIPDYARCYSTFELFNGNDNRIRPSHPVLESSFGWHFDCLFADWGTYYPTLLKLFEEKGGEIIQREVTYDSISKLDSEIIINCAEIYGAPLIGENFKPQIYRGHLLHIPGMPSLKTESGQKVSYNFTPDVEIYSTENGSEQDVYFYQRDDRWIFGGSRQKGTIDKAGNWIGEQVVEPILEINNKLYPKQILTLNQEILRQYFPKIDINLAFVQPKVGYRFMGNTDDQLRIDSVEIEDRLIVNNFGHGGSGVALSWGCTLEVLKIICKKMNLTDIDQYQFIDKLKTNLA